MYKLEFVNKKKSAAHCTLEYLGSQVLIVVISQLI